MADPYATLGVAKSATEKEIKSAYRKLAKELHPDKNKDNPKATERFSEATRAYDLLSDTKKRAQFDRGEIDADGNPAMPFGYGGGGGGFGGSGGGGFDPRDFNRGSGGFPGGGSGPDLSDLFEGIFGSGNGSRGFGGGRSAPPPKGANRPYRLAVSFADAATLSPQRITLADGKTIDLKLPAGVESGTQMRLKGKGDPGPGGAGDALVTIEIGSHPHFTRDGDNIRLDLPITLDEALRGAKMKVPTADGQVMLSIAPGSSSGQVLRLKGKGFSRKDGSFGDQLVRLVVDLPKDDPDLARRLEGWTDTRNPRSKFGV